MFPPPLDVEFMEVDLMTSNAKTSQMLFRLFSFDFLESWITLLNPREYLINNSLEKNVEPINTVLDF